ncbi:hypothetical protein [New Jersey aster yellows phytoplasma]|uniref:hypothetical protein n=1 Tax=New Jersey aster yellows phytoplasma TaxID=270520 RepID=UPI00209248AD|nr:hypothetical protein [New Jersey aster yellows phytoplasma]
MKIKKTQKILLNIINKRYFFNLFLLLTMIIATTGGIGYYFFNYFTHPVYEIIVNKNTIFQTNNDDCFDDYNNKIKQLNEEITIKNEELKEPSLSPQEKK